MLTRVHHVGLVVRRLQEGLAFWQDTLGLRVAKQQTVEDQGVKAALLPIGRSEIELLEPINSNGGVAKFLEKRGEGLHHVCFETPDVDAELATARERRFPLIDEAPRPGLAGRICFLHPKGTRGVLVEFATPPPGQAHHSQAGRFGGLALADVLVRSRDEGAAAQLFTTQLGLETARVDAPSGLTAAAVAVGGVRLVFLGAGTAAGPAATALRADLETQGEGISGLVLEVADLPAATQTLGLTDGALAPERAHGVPLRFRAT